MSQVLNEFVSLEAFGFMQDGSLLGYRLEDIEPELRCLIPRLDPSYVFEKDALSIMSAWFEIGSGEPLFISGPHGSGKTSFVNQYCARVNAPVISITARARLDRTDLIGGYVIDKDKSMRFADGPFSALYPGDRRSDSSASENPHCHDRQSAGTDRRLRLTLRGALQSGSRGARPLLENAHGLHG